jgi:hypothetical protein
MFDIQEADLCIPLPIVDAEQCEDDNSANPKPGFDIKEPENPRPLEEANGSKVE